LWAILVPCSADCSSFGLGGVASVLSGLGDGTSALAGVMLACALIACTAFLLPGALSGQNHGATAG